MVKITISFNTFNMNSTSAPIDYLPIVLMLMVAIGFVVTTMIASHWLGPKRKTKIKLDTFECGIESEGNARMPFAIKYFLVAILFVLFDIEVIFMYPWAVNFKELGMVGVIEVFSFIILLLIGFYYMLSKKALKWEE
jgi:NADH-quinone oxidoreductase subunit A